MMTRAVLWALVTIFSSILHVSADCNPGDTPVNSSELEFVASPGRCTWRGECAINPATDRPDDHKHFNCYYNGPPVDPRNDSTLMDLLQESCPMFASGSDPQVCCDVNQMETLKKQTTQAISLLSRCPACIKNFMQQICYITCSPNMSMFIDPTTILGQTNVCIDNKTDQMYITEVTVYYDKVYGERFYNSCKDVVYPEQSGKVIDVMCGSNECNTYKWFSFMGDPQLNYGQSPFKMLYSNTSHPLTNGSRPLNITIVNCFDAGSYTCSCTDCPKVCPYNPLADEGNIYQWAISVGIAAFGVLFTLTIFISSCIYSCCTYDFSNQSCCSLDYDKDQEEEEIVDKEYNIVWRCYYICSIPGMYTEYGIKWIFYRWGVALSKYWFVFLPVSLLIFGIFMIGIMFFNVTTDPVELWSAPDSQARLEKNYFDKNFSPFYRTEQVIISSKISSGFTYVRDSYEFDCGPVFNKPVLNESFYLQDALTKIVAPYRSKNGTFIKNVTLKDICFKPLEPDYSDCTIESIFNYFQNNKTRFFYEVVSQEKDDWFPKVVYNATYHIHYCTRNPTAVLEAHYGQNASGQFSCLGAYGGPIDPNTVLGGFNDTNYDSAKVLLITFVVNNHVDEELNGPAEAWEKAFLDYLKNYKGEYITVSFMAERAITDEIDRESRADIATIGISYLLMFVYIAIFLGHIRSLSTIFVDLKIILGLFGVCIVLLAVGASLGFLSFFRVEASLIIIEVVPFLVLAVGVDNLFILVHSYEREQRKTPDLKVDFLIGRALSEVAPSLLLTATSESAAFLLGAISTMPAVRAFSLYAGVAVFFNFLLQVTAFVCVMSLDAKRQKDFRTDIICLKLSKTSLSDSTRDKDSLMIIIMKFLARNVILHPLTRPIWLLVFGLTFFGSLSASLWIQLGLDQRLALPKDSYLQNYFDDMNNYLHIGPPVYFVIRDGFNYTNVENQNLVCSGSDCAPDSLGTQITMASRNPLITKIAEPPSIWLDAYFEWLKPVGKCCGHAPDDYSDYCYNPSNNGSCLYCLEHGTTRPNREEFINNLEHFLTDNPSTECAAAGHAAYGSAVVHDNLTIGATYSMTYHTILRNSSDYISALKHARNISANLTATLGHPVFPYSVFYVYYEQYLHILKDMALNIGLSLAAVLLVSILLLGLNVWAAVIILLVVIMILTHMFGFMVYTGINANAVSLVNLVMAVGISVEFCSHIVRWFISSNKRTRLLRAQDALSNMGSSVVSGITITKFLGVFILVFAKSQLFQVYYFRMYASMVLFGALHGLIILPVLLSYIGPPYCKSVLDSPYPKEPSATRNNIVTSTGPSLASLSNQQYPAPTRPKDSFYPQLPVDVNTSTNQSYPRPTEKTPLLQA